MRKIYLHVLMLFAGVLSAQGQIKIKTTPSDTTNYQSRKLKIDEINLVSACIRLRSLVHYRWPASPTSFHICTNKTNGYLPVWLFHHIFSTISNDCGKGRWLKPGEGCAEDLLLGNCCHVNDSSCWLFVWCKNNIAFPFPPLNELKPDYTKESNACT